MLLMRLILFAAVVGVVVLVIRAFVKPSPYVRCERCSGKGFWYDARGKEICDWCRGTGKMPRG